MFYPYDFFAENLEIPDNIELHIPKETHEYTPDNTTEFELYNSDQPGIYTYHFYPKGLAPGTIYLKAFEVTQNYPLSEDELRKRTQIHITSNNTIRSLHSPDNFVVQEGDWGQPYAARFEVWFKPSNGAEERKIIEKIYKIEGWQR